jgi:GH15 family glucan-1,4-alpha-glucosidase
MPLRLEDYALLGDTHSAALVGYDGSIDWLCLPRFDSPACFAALLGSAQNGRWLLAPQGGGRAVRRRYLEDSMVLETEFANSDGTVRVLDCMPPRDSYPEVVRLVECTSGHMQMRSELCLRFDYGHIVPWIDYDGRRLHAYAGPEAVTVDGDVPFRHEDSRCVAEFGISEGQQVGFRLAWTGRREGVTKGFDAAKSVRGAERWWRKWAAAGSYDGEYRDPVVRSLLTLKALTYAPSGGIVAAPTASLPEELGGVRNWDYRYCWIRDATFTLMALMAAGYEREAVAWREWLLRALAGRPEQMQIMYGVEGERRLTEIELDWLVGYAESRPVRIGNAAAGQYQLDVYGELMDALHQARALGIEPAPNAWEVQRLLLEFLESHWRDPDDGIWEIRGQRRDFTYSKVMAWVAADRAVKAVEKFGLDGDVDGWRRLRDEIHADTCEHGYDASRGTFTQYYGSRALDASLLLIAPVGFLPPGDRRVRGTVAAIEKHLCQGGFVERYTMNKRSEEVDGLPPGEGAFLPCTFWLADNYILQGRTAEGRALFDRLLALRNDVGLLTEEYDARAGRLVGNMPQAISHVALINTAHNLASGSGPVRRRAASGQEGPR